MAEFPTTNKQTDFLGNRSLVINEKKVFYGLVVCAFYLSAFQPVILGFLKYLGVNNTVIKILIQGMMYSPPILYLARGKINKALALAIFVITVSVAIPAMFHSGLKSYGLFFKNYLMLLLYLPLVSKYADRFGTHIKVIGLYYAIFCVIEFISYRNFPSLKLMLAQMSPLTRNPETLKLITSTWRPLGAYLNIHTSGAILALISAYLYSKHNFKLAAITSLGLMLSGVKTWFAYFFVFLIVSERHRFLSMLKRVAIPLIIAAPFMANYFIQEFSFSSTGSKKMLSHVVTYVPLALSTWIPFGPVPETYDPHYFAIMHLLPTQYFDSEVSLYRVVLVFGLPIFLYYIGTIYFYKNRFLNHRMRVALFASLVMFVHTAQITSLTVFIILSAMKFSAPKNSQNSNP
jgi:hypothetical protein